MSRILILPYHFMGALAPTLAFARKLSERGHEVWFAGRPDLEAMIRRPPFRFAPLFEALLPLGSLKEELESEVRGEPPWERMAKLKEDEKNALAEGELRRVVDSVKPDLVIVDSTLPLLALGAIQTGGPVLLYGAQLVSVPDALVPPWDSPLIPNRSPLFRLRNAFAWAFARFMKWWPTLVFENVPKKTRQFAVRLGLSPDLVDDRGEHLRIRLPELIFCPIELELPRAKPQPQLHFCEASVERDRPEPDLGSLRLDEKKPFIYCSLGTLAQVISAARAERTLQIVLDALALEPEWQGVVAIGSYLSPSKLRCPPNVTLVAKAPQLGLLQKATVAISHGGMNSLKEALLFGVPLVVLPLFYDQRANAARIVHHGLGETWDPDDRACTPELIRKAIQELCQDAELRARAKRFQGIFESREAEAPSIRLVEDMLKKGTLG